jgi:hypothetical protein
MLPNGNWTCITSADFAKVQAGNFDPLVPIGAAPAGPVIFTPPPSAPNQTPVVWAPPNSYVPASSTPAPIVDTTPAPPTGAASTTVVPAAPSVMPVSSTGAADGISDSFLQANGGDAGPPIGPIDTGGPATTGEMFRGLLWGGGLLIAAGVWYLSSHNSRRR